LIATIIGFVGFAGCGSAFFNSLLGAFLFRHWTGLTTEGWESLEFTNYWLPTSRKAALIAQSATGGSIETLDAARRAGDEGLFTLALTNTPGSAVEVLCDETVAFPTGQRCGPDISVITTRLMMMYLLAVELGRRNGTLKHDRAEALEQAIGTLPNVADRFLEAQERSVSEFAVALREQHALLLVGGGPNWFSAREGALKVEEECSMVCKAYRPAEYPHDAIALLSPEVTTVVIAPPGKSYQRLHDSLRTGKAAGSRGLAVVVEGDGTISRDADFVVSVPGGLDEMLFPPLATIVFQLLGYYLGIERGYNPDTLRTDNLDHARAWLTSFPLGTH
jgi:glucosamine--fructose-6-phosphate aminotransferase (isomerizing)